MKKYLIAIAFITLNLVACASSGNGSNTTDSSTTTYGNQPISPTVSSRAASSEEFPEENQLTPNN